MFAWFTKRRRRKLLTAALPENSRKLLRQNVWQYSSLPRDLQIKLEDCVKVFVAEKYWEGCNGLQVSELMKLTIAGQASLMLLGTDDYYFEGVRTILLYPRSFRRKSKQGWIVDEDQHNAGEAWQGGPIVLSWADVRKGNQAADGQNVVVHEFAHHLDGLDGEMGGSPPFDNPDDQQHWYDVLQREHQALRHAAQTGQWALLDYYGATNQAEFFAVASEFFFELPVELQQAHPELYELLTRLYKVDPRQWL